ETFTLEIATSSSRDAYSARWDMKRQPFHLLLPHVTFIKKCNHDLGKCALIAPFYEEIYGSLDQHVAWFSGRLNWSPLMALNQNRWILINGYSWKGAFFRHLE
ncbi:hypothetical protein L195_g051146, partial [Trifolium pratense]